MADLDAYRGKLALVTGAGDGIGAMIARSLAHSGMRVCVQDIRADAAAEVAEEIGGDAFPLVFDVSDRDACLGAAEALRKTGPLNLLWLNAGVGVGASVLHGKANAVEWGFGVNALGVIWTAQAFLPQLQAAQGARHVGITASSASLRAPEGDFPLYATTKHATFAIGEALRAEFKEIGIGTTILCPGLLNTDIWDAARARPDRFGGERHMDPKIAAHWRQAKSPELMWPHIARNIENGGGYLVCATEPGTRAAFEARAAEIAASIVNI